MSAVSKNVIPASSAASTTAAVAARSSRHPKLLQPSPTRETSRSEPPRRRDSISRSYASPVVSHFRGSAAGADAHLGHLGRAAVRDARRPRRRRSARAGGRPESSSVPARGRAVAAVVNGPCRELPSRISARAARRRRVDDDALDASRSPEVEHEADSRLEEARVALGAPRSVAAARRPRAPPPRLAPARRPPGRTRRPRSAEREERPAVAPAWAAAAGRPGR